MKNGLSGHESQNSKSVDWYTPSWIFDRIGLQFDLDPCQPTGGSGAGSMLIAWGSDCVAALSVMSDLGYFIHD